MDVASLVVICCLAQSGDRYGSYGTTPSYTPPAATNPYGATSAPPAAAMPYPAQPQDPIYTAAAPKKNAAAGPTSPSPTTGAGTRSATTNTTTTSTPKPQPGVITTPIPPKNSPPPSTATTDKSAAGELVREAVVVPQSLSVEGRSTSLYEAIAYAGDARRQLDAVRSYWKLTADLAEYHFAWQQTQFLEHLQKVTASRSGESPATASEIAARLASARAVLREAELRLNESQVELAERGTLAGGATRPLPVDLPHVGTYRTQFERVFAGRAAPQRAHLLNRTLPLRKEVVDVRADGVWAAQDAYEAAFEAYQKGQLPVEEVLTALDDFRLRRSEFIVAVRRYNDEIVEYAVLSSPAGIPAATLVGMLIKNPTRPAPGLLGSVDGDAMDTPTLSGSSPTFSPTPDPVSSNVAGDIVPTAAMLADPRPITPTPIVPKNAPPNITASRGTPTLAPARIEPAADARLLQPAVAPPSTSNVPSSSLPNIPFTPSPPATATSDGSIPAPPSFNDFTPSAGNPLRGQPTLAPPPSTTPNPPPSGEAPVPRYRVNKIPLNAGEPTTTTMRDDRVLPVGYYTNLVSLPPAERAQDLVEVLYTAPIENREQATVVSLADCLSAVTTPEHAFVVQTYWSAAEQAARVTAWSVAAERLDALGQATLRMSDSPAKTAAMLRVRSSRLAADAERLAARAALEAQRAQLTEAVHRSLTEPWLSPQTLPHGGGYQTKVEALPASFSQSPNVRKLAGKVDVLHDTLQLRAEAVVQSEAATEALLQQFSSGQATSHTVTAAVRRQTRETEALLNVTTRYNLAIAGYALAVLPQGTPRDTLVGALVVNRTAVASRP